VAREVGSVRLLKEERHLPLEMGEREQDIEREPAHRGGGVELLGDRDERYPARVDTKPPRCLPPAHPFYEHRSSHLSV